VSAARGTARIADPKCPNPGDGIQTAEPRPRPWAIGSDKTRER
jgi:hypothetical protein